MTPADGDPAGTTHRGTTAAPELAAYRASASFAAAFRRYRRALRAGLLEVRAYNTEHPDLPLALVRYRLDHTIKVVGFTHARPDQAVPDGLILYPERGEHLVPVPGGPGKPWRAVLRHHRRQIPHLIDTVFTPHGAPVYHLTATSSHTATVHDLGDHGVFVTIADGYRDPGRHLTAVPLQEFRLAQASHENRTVS
ncbi:hypothetical protein C8D87_11416 [Lentzea atacamensis]|uniref:Uncharacterized protein n=1 Tax=Lentzea atacamensis TaxID=531938 RepID=A0ABX9DY96_9PSEU|nr:hypothetical protein [Lentzea atacamensis]RAS59404.1 hypothetical protein C8D87_11416 [Lentzea atacamensis]